MAENVTIMKTPPKRACSTESKRKAPSREKIAKALPFNMDTTGESLGILSFNDVSSIHPDFEQDIPTRDGPSRGFMGGVTSQLMKNPAYKRMMERADNSHKTPDKISSGYQTYTPGASSVKMHSAESTVCEMDLLRNNKTENSYEQNRFSLPTFDKKSISSELDQISNKIKNTDLSIKDIFSSYLNCTENAEMDSAMFASGEAALEKIKADEISWRKAHDLPVSKRESDFSSFSVNDDKGSMSKFFALKSNECSAIFRKKSPERGPPVPLINSTINDSKNNISINSSINNSKDISINSINSTQDISINSSINQSKNNIQPAKPRDESSLVSLSQINNLLASNDTTPTKFIDLITNYKKNLSAYSKESLHKLNRSSSTVKSSLGNSQTLNSNPQFNKKVGSMSNAQSLNSLSDTDKENRNTLDKSLSSIRSASSMDFLPNGKLAIQCTKGELTWDCVKLGKVGTQDFVVRNRYNHRTRFQISSSNPNYKISNIDSDPLLKKQVQLHPMESRKFTICFTPSSIGSQTGKLVFNPIIKGELQKAQRQTLRMHGYGGHANIEIQKISKDSTGKFWLSLGHISSQSSMQQNFMLKNNGTIPGFAWFSIATKTICSFTNIEIHPSHVVLKPNEQVNITVLYTPSKQDFKHITTNFNCGMEVFEIAQIKAVTGSEATRARLNRLTQKLKEDKMEIENLLKEIGKPFEGECIPSDLKHFNESFEALKELKYHLNSRDISLTIEQDPDKTLIDGLDEMESSLFQTLTNSMSNFTIAGGSANKTIVDCFIAEPSTIILTPPFKVADSILFTSESKITLTYDVKLEPEGVIEIGRRDGMIRAGETKVLRVKCAKVQSKGKQTVRVLISVDNDILVVEVKVVFNLKQ